MSVNFVPTGQVRPIRVGIVEDNPLFLDLVAASLDSVIGLEVVATSKTVAEARSVLADLDIDVAVLDIDLPDGNGVGLGVWLSTNFPRPGIVLLSATDMLELFLGLPEETRAGWSYLAKSSSTDLDVLTKTIQATARGRSIIDPSLVDRSRAKSGGRVSRLTKRQFEVLRAVSRGLSNQAIADEFGFSLKTVVAHLSAIYAALDIPEGSNPRVHSVLEFLQETDRS
ncbi:MAG: DNA-binding response regulator [Microbacteriaceae bacterium]|nr:DNA-binding response regulator [Microbacteriaceae bacterium]